MNRTIEELNLVCANEHFFSDEDIVRRLKSIYDKQINEGLQNGGMELINHEWSNRIIERRVKKYCENHKIKLEDYNGPLPYRLFKVSVK